MSVHPAVLEQVAVSMPNHIRMETPNSKPPKPVYDDPLAKKHSPGCCELFIIGVCSILGYLPCIWVKGFQTLNTYERAIVYRLGALKSRKCEGPGLIQFNYLLDELEIMDIRDINFDLPKQTLLTKDTLTIAVDAVVYYKIVDPIRAATRVNNINRAVQKLAMTQMRSALSKYDLKDIMAEKDVIAQQLGADLNFAVSDWGVKVSRIDIKNINLPRLLIKVMAAEAQAARDAKANILNADGEKKAAKDLVGAAKLIGTDGGAMQLRMLQAFEMVSSKNNKTFAIPISECLVREVQKNGLQNVKLNIPPT